MRDTIAVCLMQTYEEDFLRDALNSVYAQATEYGLHVQVFSTFEQLYNNELYNRGCRSIFERISFERLCGMLIFCANLKDAAQKQRLIESAKANEIPVVLFDQQSDDCYSVTFDHSDAIQKVVRHLIEVHNCKTFFIMGGNRNNRFSDERIDAVRSTAAEYGIQIPDDCIGYGDFWEVPCKEEMERFFASGRPLPDAFIAANDLMAIAICEALHQKGYRVPKDTIVTGFDGAEEERYALLRLTTCQQDIAAGGRRAVEMIWNVMQHIETERDTVIPFAVHFSQSCGCVPISDNDSSGAKVQDMFRSLKAYKQFTRFMYELMDAASETRTLEGVLNKLPTYLKYVDSFSHIYICVEGRFLDTFDTITARLMKQNIKLSDPSEVELVLLGEWHTSKGFKVPLLPFRRSELLPPECNGEDTNYMMMVPLHVQDTVMGYLAVDFTPLQNNYNQLRNFSATLSHILDSAKSQQQMRNFNHKLKKANDKLEDLYIRDPLTGIYNRRGFYQNIIDCIKAHSYGWIMTISVDLNDLKGINDNYGHGEGDFAIRTLGRILDKCVARDGICARFGGDEFSAAIFFDEYEQYAAQEFRSNLMRRLDEVNRTAGKEYQITCSCGIQLTSITQDVNIDELLKEADHKMYEDKKQFYDKLES